MLPGFHPLITRWFLGKFRGPTGAQLQGWSSIQQGQDTLIAAPTGSGKTLAAFLVCLDDLFRQAIRGELPQETQIVYVSPLKALSNDIERNLQGPLAELHTLAQEECPGLTPVRVSVRTGDTPAHARQRMLSKPPHLVVTTPESLYLLLTSERGRKLLRTVKTVIVDEIHALARDKRGSHLALSLARLDHLADVRPQRIGLSATQKPLSQMAHFLVGNDAAGGQRPCHVVDVGHLRELDLNVEVPPTPLEAVCSHETWGEIYERLAALIDAHKSTIVFVNTRKLAERIGHQLQDRLGAELVCSHHGSLSKELRHSAETRLKNGQLKALVATASMELGIDVGYIDLCCQIGSPRSIATFLQRVGRAGHALGAIPKGRLFPLTRDELVESLALIQAVRQGRLDAIQIPKSPVDILAQQIVAEVACQDWDEEALYQQLRQAWPYADMTRELFSQTLTMLSDGIRPGSRAGAFLHRDQINHRLTARRHARISALSSGGAIPETGDFRVILAGEETFVGTLNEDFALESNAGDIFQLGNASWRVQSVRGDQVLVTDAQGAPATIPFWLGEAPGRTFELSAEVAALREQIAACFGPRSDESNLKEAEACVQQASGVTGSAARQAAEYIHAQHAALGIVPTQKHVVFERFFDETGGMQLIIHAPFGMRVNRAWGLTMRKRFCRSFDFELQAAANDNGINLSLGPQHSFPVDALFQMLNPQNASGLLEQAILAVPMFRIRWRWNVTRALVVARQSAGKRVPPNLQRFRAEDALTAVFPSQTGCLENLHGDMEIPDHPLVQQTMRDCLQEAMDLEAFLQVLADKEKGQITFVARDTREPSPFAYELLNGAPYTFLDNAPLEERRARAVATRRGLNVEEIRDLAQLDPAAISQVRQEALPAIRDEDELHDALVQWGLFQPDTDAQVVAWFSNLVRNGRAATATLGNGRAWWIAAEKWPWVLAMDPAAVALPVPKLPEVLAQAPESAVCLREFIRGWLEFCGPIRASHLAQQWGLPLARVLAALEALEGEGIVLRGKFMPEEPVRLLNMANGSLLPLEPVPHHQEPRPAGQDSEWCNRRLLARIHRLTLDAIRKGVQPVPPSVYWRYLLENMHLAAGQQRQGSLGLLEVITQLQGCEFPAGAWEREILPSRVLDFDPQEMDALALSGELAWGRLLPPRKQPDASPTGGKLHRLVPTAVFAREALAWLLPPERENPLGSARESTRAVWELLKEHGALFFQDLAALAGLLPTQLEDCLSELAALGLATSDGFASLRQLAWVKHAQRSALRFSQARRHKASGAMPKGGRWTRFPPPVRPVEPGQRVANWADLLLNRYGVVWRDLVVREPLAPAWSELLLEFRRKESRQQIRGGRFISGLWGEQFARAETVERLRALRDTPSDPWPVVFSAVDPANLSGLLDDDRVPAHLGNALAVQNGRVVASRQTNMYYWNAEFTPEEQAELVRQLSKTAIVRMAHTEVVSKAALGIQAGPQPEPTV